MEPKQGADSLEPGTMQLQTRSGRGHLQGGGEDEALADGGVGGLAGGPLFAQVLFGQPVRPGKDAGVFAGDGGAGFLSEPEHLSDRIDFLDPGVIAVEAEEGVAGDAQGGGQADAAVRAAGQGEDVAAVRIDHDGGAAADHAVNRCLPRAAQP